MKNPGLPTGSIFLAYPSNRGVADSMTRLAADLRDLGATVTTWQQISNPGFLFPPIKAAIDDCELFLAETTFGNPNVLFELGYAIARGKHVLQMEDRTAAKPRRLDPLSTVRAIHYERRPEIIEYLSNVDLTGATLAEQMGLPYLAPEPGSLYFIPSRRGGDCNDTISKVCSSGIFDYVTIGTGDTDYDTLTAQAKLIATSETFVTYLVSEGTAESWDNNAQLMLYAGLASEMSPHWVVMTRQPLSRLLDLEDQRIAFQSETEAEFRLHKWLTAVVNRQLTSPPVVRTVLVKDSPLTGLFFGGLDARTDARLDEYFYETPEFHQAEAGQRYLFVGSKGAGKTANFSQLEARLQSRNQVVVTIAPADFEFPRLSTVLDEHIPAAHWQFVYGSFWRFVLITEILRGVREKFLDHVLRESTINQWAADLLRWFSEHETLLSLDFVSRVTTLLATIQDITGDQQQRREQLESTLQLARMYEIEKNLDGFLLDFPVRILIDDLDRNWDPTQPSSNGLILALLNELENLMGRHKPRLTVTAFLRKDVYRWLTSNDAEFQKRDAVLLAWTSESLELLIANRIYTYTKYTETDPTILWGYIFPTTVRGEPVRDFILSRTLVRPRDAIQFCQRAVESAQHAGRAAVNEQDVYDAWEPVGQLMLAQIETEYQHHYPALEYVALAFLDAPVSQPFRSLTKGIEETISGLDPLPNWMIEATTRRIDFVRALYETGVVGVETSGGARWFEGQRSFSELEPALGQDFQVVLHPAFHRYFRCWGT